MEHRYRGKAIFLSLSVCFYLSTGMRAGAEQQPAASPPTARLEDGVIILSNVYPSDRRSLSSDHQSPSNEPSPFASAENDAIPQTSYAAPVTAYESLASAITSAGSSRRRAALRMVEEARQLLEAGQYEKALRRLETSLGLDANPYIYFYLALTHYRLSHDAEAAAFLAVAESSFHGQPNWTAELLAWKKTDQEALQDIRSAPTLALKETPQAKSTTLARASDEPSRRKHHESNLVDLLAMSSSLSFFWLLIWLASSAHLRHGEK